MEFATGSVLDEGCVNGSKLEPSDPHKLRTEPPRAVASLDVGVSLVESLPLLIVNGS
jgi:hypothetical protein